MARNQTERYSDDPRIRVFDRIAPIYGLLFRVQRLAFRRGFRALLGRLALPPGARVLDIGCGTGAYVSVLAGMGFEARAVDASPRMVATARRLLRRSGLDGPALRVEVGDPLGGLAFPDGHFDLVLAAHVIHGLRPAGRRRFYREAKRVSRDRVLFYDYAPRAAPSPGFVTRVLEALERSDYRRFRRAGLRELRAVFPAVEVIAGPPGTAWYLCGSRS